MTYEAIKSLYLYNIGNVQIGTGRNYTEYNIEVIHNVLEKIIPDMIETLVKEELEKQKAP